MTSQQPSDSAVHRLVAAINDGDRDASYDFGSLLYGWLRSHSFMHRRYSAHKGGWRWPGSWLAIPA